EKSFQFLAPEDIAAMVAYLRTVPKSGDVDEASSGQPRHGFGKPISSEPTLRGAAGPNELNSLTTGASLFSGNCAACHQADASGSGDQFYPSLFHNTATGARNPSNLLATILFGVERTVGGQQVMMPRFDGSSPVNPLSDEQVASIANYVLAQYGNPAVQVVAADVRQTREGGPKPLLAKVQPVFAPLAFIVPILLIVLVVWLLARRRRRQAGRLGR
ncbi:MAG: cytochrome, partial [Rhodoferax sp.]|nr:cytochrome [Rhodoferax sp.]